MRLSWLQKLVIKKEVNSIIGGLFKMQYVKSWWLAHATWIAAIVTFLMPSLQNYMMTHKGTTGAFILSVVLARITQSYIFPKQAAMILLALFLFTIPTRAQQNPPPAFSVTTLAVAWHGAGANEAGTDAVGRYRVSPHWQARNDNIILPGQGVTVNTIGAEACTNPKVSLWQACGAGEFGSVAQGGPSHLAYDFSFHLGYDSNGDKKFSYSIFDAILGHGGITETQASPGTPIRIANTWLVLAAGVKVSF
jgi:hypothetical protein